MKFPVIIKDNSGGELILTKTRLIELTGEAIEGMKWYLNLRSLLKPQRTVHPHVYVKLLRNGYERTGWAVLVPEVYRIGCRYFDKKTFELIMKAAKATKGVKKKKK